MDLKPRKKIAPTLVAAALPATDAIDATDATDATRAFKQAAQKKNPLETAADLIALRYGVLGDAPQINEDAFAKNRAVGKKVVPLKDYFEHTAKEFVQAEADKKEDLVKKKREIAKLSPCQRKMNTLQRNLEGYVESCDPVFSNESVIEMMDTARAKAAAATKAATKAAPKKTRRKINASARSSASKRGGGRRKKMKTARRL
jgi:hypothetical protein